MNLEIISFEGDENQQIKESTNIFGFQQIISFILNKKYSLATYIATLYFLII